MSAHAEASVHRFQDFAAVALPGDGETVYLTPDDARELGAALIACADNVTREPSFSASNFPTVSIELSNGGSRYRSNT